MITYKVNVAPKHVNQSENFTFNFSKKLQCYLSKTIWKWFILQNTEANLLQVFNFINKLLSTLLIYLPSISDLAQLWNHESHVLGKMICSKTYWNLQIFEITG